MNTRIDLKTIGIKKLNIIFLLVFVLCIAIFSVSYIYSHNLNNPPIRSDGYGYYSYLPSFIINNDLSFKSLSQKPDGYIYPGTNKFLNKYTVGTAILQMPFFLIAHLLSKVMGFNDNGFSILYQYSNIVSAFFYFIIGLFFLHKIIKSITEKILADISIIITVFGTNLFHYTTYDASFSHIYSFCMITLFLYFVIELNKKETIYKHIIIGFLLGIITMIRVTNIIIVIFYLLYGIKSFADFSRKFLNLYNYKYYLVALITFFLTFLPQCLYWYNITGHLILNSYQKEGFNWFNPQVINFLFSMKKGLFFWTPLWVISIFGIFLSRKNNPNIFLPLVIYLPLQIYICSSWWCWDYGGSFGQRPFTDIASIFALNFAIILKEILETKISIGKNGDIKIHVLPIFLMFILLFVLLNIFEMVGYWNHIIPYTNTNLQNFKNLINWYLHK